MMRIPHNRLSHDEAECESVSRLVSSGFWAGGTEVQALERTLCDFFNVKYAVCVSSGVSALRLGLLSQKKKGSCVVPAYSCVALANAALAAGYAIKAFDSSPNDFNLRLVDGDHTAAVVVNTFGQPAEVQDTSCFTLEDCSHGFSYNYETSTAGIRGDAAILSFYATKLIGGGEGGVILTNDKNISDFAYDWRDYTDKAPDGTRLNDKMSNIHAAVILSQFRKLPKFLHQRKELATRYTNAFSSLKHFDVPEHSSNSVHYRYVLKKKSALELDDVIAKLDKQGISCCAPVELWVDNAEGFPNALNAYRTTLSIPLYPSLTYEEQDYIITKIRELDEQLD